MANKRIKIVSRKSKLEKAKSSSGNNPLRLSKMLFKKYSPLFLKKKLWLFAVPLFAIILMFSLRGISDQSDLQTTDASAELPVQMSVEAQKKGGDVDFYILKKGEDLYDGLKELKVSRLVIPSILDKVKDKISESQLLGGQFKPFLKSS